MSSEENFDFESLVDQAELKEDCPCSSGKNFGSCCGSGFDCDCDSKWPAGECCYSADAEVAEVS